MSVVVAFISGAMVGGFVGVAVMCLLSAGKNADRAMGIRDDE